MRICFKHAQVWKDGSLRPADILVSDGRIVSIGDRVSCPTDTVCVEVHNAVIFPGFVDVHVHLREPGFSYKETIRTGTLAAAHGGFAHVAAMPNLNPVPDCKASLEEELRRIRESACVHVHPYGAISVGQKGEQLADLDAMVPEVIAFSDDGKGVQSESLMREAMEQCRRLGKILAAHCEDNRLLRGGYIHDGAYAKTHSHRGICSESEWGQIARDVRLAEETGCAYHVCHVSTKESVSIIREAKRRGVNVTCETGPHYLTFTEDDLQEDGRFKMNPPLRSREDRDALIEGLLDGTIDMIVTDHAPHSREKKRDGRCGSGNLLCRLLHKLSEARRSAARKACGSDARRADAPLWLRHGAYHRAAGRSDSLQPERELCSRAGTVFVDGSGNAVCRRHAHRRMQDDND